MLTYLARPISTLKGEFGMRIQTLGKSCTLKGEFGKRGIWDCIAEITPQTDSESWYRRLKICFWMKIIN